jgi:hypothetical protein
MHREPDGEAGGVREREPWARVVVCRFAGAALANGEGIILVPTLTHRNGIRPRLEAEGVATFAFSIPCERAKA